MLSLMFYSKYFSGMTLSRLWHTFPILLYNNSKALQLISVHLKKDEDHNTARSSHRTGMLLKRIGRKESSSLFLCTNTQLFTY